MILKIRSRVGVRETWFAWHPVVLTNGYNMDGENPGVSNLVWWEKVYRTRHGGRHYLYEKWERPSYPPGVHRTDSCVITAHERRKAELANLAREDEARKAREEIAANGT